MKMDVKLNILTLNCWGIVGISRHRKQRMEAIATHIASSNYDFVFLQEIWSQDDYQMICKKSADVLPFSYYFHSGVLGSGVCILSKSCIVDAAQSQYSLNGYAHKILHGDWYGGKVVGLCKVIHHGLKINLYVTHLHAEYNTFHDQYLPHRVAQAFEFSQFVQLTSETADLSIVAGDFNTEPTDLPYRVIVHNAGCLDAYLAQKDPFVSGDESIKTTCGHPDNLYTSRKELNECPTGKRIDYILYKCGAGTHVECLSCNTTLGKIPDSSIPYSDHEAVIATLHVFKSLEAPRMPENPKARLEAIDSSHIILRKNMKQLQNSRLLFFMISFLLMALLAVTALIDNIGFFEIFIIFFQFVATFALAFCLWMALIVNKIEQSALMSACKAMEVLTNALMNEYNMKLSTTFLPSAPPQEVIL
ncbi:putative neutral sphingomyelinase [Parasteatoda tepidariorum]|uniref:sphingomyelin phosphodiesterase n=1 Tax=Parasteatoda tepidariorum TaxID=114398 RepID=A0A2L2YAH5_PARTP|nr:putative neutral sphingomyelinase [Parasteatoda tepidariorum]